MIFLCSNNAYFNRKMDLNTRKQELGGVVLHFKPFARIHDNSSSKEIQKHLAKRLIYRVEELIFVLFITILVPIAIIIFSLVLSCFYINHLQGKTIGYIQNVIKGIEQSRKDREIYSKFSPINRLKKNINTYDYRF